jgi:RNA polymerase sigma factor (sigma-70 family)
MKETSQFLDMSTTNAPIANEMLNGGEVSIATAPSWSPDASLPIETNNNLEVTVADQLAALSQSPRFLGWIANRMMSSQQYDVDPQDVVQETVIRGLTSKSSINAPTSYSRTVAINILTNMARHRRVIESNHGARTEYNEQAVNVDDTMSDDFVDGLVERTVLDAALNQLPESQRQVLKLRFYDDLSEAQIANKMGVAPGTVKSHCSRGLNRLRLILTEPQALRSEA